MKMRLLPKFCAKAMAALSSSMIGAINDSDGAQQHGDGIHRRGNGLSARVTWGRQQTRSLVGDGLGIEQGLQAGTLALGSDTTDDG